MSIASSHDDHRFGRFRFSAPDRLLFLDDAPTDLGARAQDLLLALLEARGRTLSKDELLQRVWAGRAVEENNLTVQVAALRRALAVGGLTDAVITVPGQGYRFRMEVLAPAAATTPAYAPLVALPAPPTVFIGRSADIAALRDAMARNRLVTIAGPGGIGKTRMALHLGKALSAEFAGQVWMADLARIAEPQLVAEAVAAACGLAGAGGPAEPRLLGFLQQRRALLILDNCEHLAGAVAALAAKVLATCPAMALLATSRESLGIPGEGLYRLPPLTVPDAVEGLTAATALRFDSVRLLVERAADAVPGFALTDANAAAVARICAGLDGIALAIEMVVPRLRVLSPDHLAERLHERFRLLVGARNAATRQRTLRAVLDWSWELLSAAEQRLLRRLAVFAGGATLDAVMAVAAEPWQDEVEVLGLLDALVDKSLLFADTTGPAPRYRLLETTRDYAAERQAESGEAPLRNRHAAHFAARFEAAEAAWPLATHAAWVAAHTADADNLRAALRWALEEGRDPALGLRLAASSYPLWWDLPALPLREGRRWLARAQSALGPETPPGIAARIWFANSWRDMRFADRENHPAALRAVALFREAGEASGLGAALWRAGSALLTRETAAEAAPLIEEAVAVLRAMPRSRWLGLALVRRGDLLTRQDRLEEALPDYEEALAIFQDFGWWYGLVNAGSNMAALLYDMGQRERALAQLLRLREAVVPGLRLPLMATLSAHLALAGREAEARAVLGEVVALAPASGLDSALAWACQTLA
ncbi:MAG: winged helix-turn-helix domain-containing protein, partial [Acetobacteraceae bacterium]|nr:winged helix-turn-helix domain-containing protein [Acetobacteraceae bacterium]